MHDRLAFVLQQFQSMSSSFHFSTLPNLHLVFEGVGQAQVPNKMLTRQDDRKVTKRTDSKTCERGTRDDDDDLAVLLKKQLLLKKTLMTRSLKSL